MKTALKTTHPGHNYRPESVEIIDVGPRDGLQNEQKLVGTEAKLRYINHLVDAGIRRIEAVSFAHPRLVPQMADAEAVMAAVPRDRGVSYIGLVLNERGFDRAVATRVDEINIVVVASDTFSDRNQGMTTQRSLEAAATVRELARAHPIRVSITIAAAFGCPFEGEVTLDRLSSIVSSCHEIRPDELALADTIGVGVPQDVIERVRLTRDRTDLPLRCHFHNTRNTGYANALTAIQEGVLALDSSAGGIGGCPFAPAATGNIATEDLVYALNRSRIRHGVSLEGIIRAASFIAQQLGSPVPALLGRAGDFPGDLATCAPVPA
jgi:hydroxymethylglutaryl-CoA lyase